MAATTDLAGNKLEPEPIPGATVEVSTDAVDESEVQPLPSSDVPDVEASADVGDGDPSEREVSVVPDSKKWPGWPGHCVFRMIVPVVKVGSIIGRKGEFIKKMCEETKARIRILEGVVGTTDRIVLITGKEEPDAEFSPAMSGLLRVFRRINGIPDSDDDGSTTALQPLCSSRILVASTQAISLIGKGGVVIKSIQEGSGATVRVLPGEELPHYAVSDERIVDIQGEPLNVLKALELVVGQLRKFLVDQSIIPLFEKNLSSSITSAAQDRVVDKTPASVHGTTHTGISNDYPAPLMRDPLYYERESHLDSHLSRSGLALYGQDPALSTQRPSGLGRTPGALVTQITQTMQIPLSYAEDIIGIGGANIAYIRRTSGAILTVQESRGLSDEITVEIKGSSSEVHTAQQLIQDFIAGHKEPAGGSYGGLDSNYMSSYSQLGSAPYSSSSLPSQHGSSGRLGGYGGYRY